MCSKKTPNILTIGGEEIALGERKKLSLKVARLYDNTGVRIPVEVVRGTKNGPRLFVSAAIHGDELNGVEIIKRLLKHKALKNIKGTLIAVPIVNVHGYNSKSRYLPDRKDLNRFFPGSPTGSLASQVAYVFMEEIVKKCTHGVDLHTGAIYRTNLPQVRADLDDPETCKLAHAFKVPVMVNTQMIDGSLREASRELGIPMILFEGGEALRHDEHVIRSGLNGVLTLMNDIGMIEFEGPRADDEKVFKALSRHWARAPESGSFKPSKKLGDAIKEGQRLATITDPFGAKIAEIRSKCDGIIIGAATMPLLHKGDPVFHIASFDDVKAVEEEVDDFLEEKFKA